MKKSLIIMSLIFLFVFICGKTTFAQTISGSINEKTVRRGKTASGKIILMIPNELHVNSNMPVDEFLIPTTVKFTGSNIKINKIIYPKGIFRKFDFSDKPLSVYEGQTVIRFTFFIPANVRDKQVTINAEIQYQACNQEVCFPPKKEKITFSAKVK